MNIRDKRKELSKRLDKWDFDKAIKHSLEETSTRDFLINPFFEEILGYSRMDHFIPEFTADMGNNRRKKVDMAINFGKEHPSILVECKKATKLVLDSMNISNHFSSMITRDDSHERTIQIKKSVEFLSLSPQEIVVIGDRIHDVNSAKQVGCSAILSNKNKLDSFKESPVISELSELKKINFSKL